MHFNFKNYNLKYGNMIIFLMVMFSCLLFINGCSIDPEITTNEWYDANEYYAGGNTTLFEATSGAFSTPAPNLSLPNLEKHFEGDLTFEATFVTAPATNNAGLGPIYNNVSCVSCHILDGRGNKPSVFRISIPGTNPFNGPNPVPGMGDQLQDKAIIGELAEGLVQIFYTEEYYNLPDGTPYSLRKPNYTIENTYIPLPAETMLSVRAAPPVFGLGLLEAIPENDGGDGVRIGSGGDDDLNRARAARPEARCKLFVPLAGLLRFRQYVDARHARLEVQERRREDQEAGCDADRVEKRPRLDA